MYESYFQLNEKPFNITPDPLYFYPSHKHQIALDSMVYAIQDRRGFVVITGDIGSGKTITCRTVLTKLEKGTKTAIITNTHLSNKQLLMTVLDAFGIQTIEKDKSKLLKLFYEFLLEQDSLGNIVVLIVDEAQNLSRSVLEEIRMLSNLETEKHKLIQIVLMGQPELKDKLKQKNLAQLRQRVAIHYHLLPLSADETMHYIRHRIEKAQASEEKRELFEPSALQAVHHYAGGVPRLINIICDNALLTAFAHDMHCVTREIVLDAVKDNSIFEDHEPIPSQSVA